MAGKRHLRRFETVAVLNSGLAGSEPPSSVDLSPIQALQGADAHSANAATAITSPEDTPRSSRKDRLMLLRILLLAGALQIVSSTSWAQTPLNDDCPSARIVSAGITPYDSRFATDGVGLALDPSVCDMGPFGDEQIYQDVWFRFTPMTTAPFDLFVFNNGNLSFDGKLALYAQSSCPDEPANVIACNDDISIVDLQPGVFGVPLVAGTTYIARVGSYSPMTLEIPAALRILTAPLPPPNDDCANAQAVTTGLTRFDSTNATDGMGLALDPMVCDMGPFGDEQLYQDVWFSFTPASTDFYDLHSVNNGNFVFDSRIAVYDQSTCPADPSNVIACNDDFNGLEAGVPSVSLTAGNTYLVRIGSYSPFTGEQPAALSITAGSVPPVNDACSNAIALPAGYSTTPYDNVLATTDGASIMGSCLFNPLDADGLAHSDIWFTYTPSNSGCTYISTLNQTAVDTRIVVYDSANCPASPAGVLACSDDEVQPITPPFEAGLDVVLNAHQTYLIRLGNYGPMTVGGPGNLVIAPGPVAIDQDMGLQTGAPGCPAGEQFLSVCNGDGGNQMGCTSCPCGNESPPGTVGGCKNSSGNSTAIAATGSTSLSLPPVIGETSDLRLTLTGAPANAFCVMLSGNAVAPQNPGNPCFGMNSGAQAMDRDGLRCAVQGTIRHGGRSADDMGQVMNSTGPSRVWGGEAQPAAGIGNQGGFVVGQTRYFQVTHREDALSVCMRGLNTSQAVRVRFTP